MRDIYVESVHAIITVSGIHSLNTMKGFTHGRKSDTTIAWNMHICISHEVLTSKLFLHSLHFISF